MTDALGEVVTECGKRMYERMRVARVDPHERIVVIGVADLEERLVVFGHHSYGGVDVHGQVSGPPPLIESNADAKRDVVGGEHR